MTLNAGWTSVRVVASDSDAARVRCLESLFAAGAQGVQEDGAVLVTHFPPGTNLEEVAHSIAAVDDGASIQLSSVPDIDWSEAWKSQLTGHDVGPLTIVPPWLADGRDASHTIVIEPGMAFGTGDHPTTRGVIRLLPAVVQTGHSVADLGAGSAVLSIAAARLGALRVFAIELDHDAIADAEANVVRNGVADRVHVFEGDAAALLPLVAPVHVVLANIVSSVLVPLLDAIRDALHAGGHAILAGILRDERAEMLSALHTHGWHVVAEDEEDIWWSVTIARA